MEAGKLQCPSCGAPVSSDRPQCLHCQTLLQTVACPSCMGLMFLGGKFCSHCGAAAASAQVEPQGTHRCPRCLNSMLHSMSVRNVPLEECGRCGGIWVGNQAFEKICADREAQQTAVFLPVPPAVVKDYSMRYLKCPQCTTIMARYNFSRHSGVLIDRCPKHGIWLDRDEIRQIIEFIRAGGVSKGHQSEIEELKSQRRQLEAAQHAASMGRPIANTDGIEHRSVSDLLGGLAGVLLSLLK